VSVWLVLRSAAYNVFTVAVVDCVVVDVIGTADVVSCVVVDDVAVVVVVVVHCVVSAVGRCLCR